MTTSRWEKYWLCKHFLRVSFQTRSMGLSSGLWGGRKYNWKSGQNTSLPPSFREHFCQHSKSRLLCGRADTAESSDKSSLVNGSDLVQNHLTVFALKSTGHACRVRSTLRSHGSDNNCGNVSIHLIRGDDEAGSSLSNLTPDGWIKVDQVDIKPLDYHFHSLASHWVSTGSSSSRSSPCSAIARNCSSQP